jgi:hypothetical protein
MLLVVIILIQSKVRVIYCLQLSVFINPSVRVFTSRTDTTLRHRVIGYRRFERTHCLYLRGQQVLKTY